jgi:hypothetical protein
MEQKKNNLTINEIQHIVSDYFNMTIGQMNNKTRKREIVQVRQISMYFSRELTELSLSKIGLKHGEKDHATVDHSHKTVSNLYGSDKSYRVDIDKIEKRLVKKSNEKYSQEQDYKSKHYFSKDEIDKCIYAGLAKLALKRIPILKRNIEAVSLQIKSISDKLQNTDVSENTLDDFLHCC